MSVDFVLPESTEVLSVRAGKAVFWFGDIGREMYLVLSGEVELRYGASVLATIQPGQTFGELALLEDFPRSTSAFATVDSVIAVIDEDCFLELVRRCPAVALQVMRAQADRMLTSYPGLSLSA